VHQHTTATTVPCPFVSHLITLCLGRELTHEYPVQSSNRKVKRRYAVLHDFCMQIPYSVTIMVSGVILAIRGPIAAGVLMFICGILTALCARESLRRWKLAQTTSSSTFLFTFVSAYLTWVWGALPCSAQTSCA
jgi:hypothetical protein